MTPALAQSAHSNGVPSDTEIAALARAYAIAQQAVIDHYNRTGLFDSSESYDAADESTRREWKSLSDIRAKAETALLRACAVRP